MPGRVPVRALAALAVGVAAWTATGAGVRATYGARTTADEPQYLLTAISLAEDRDLDIADELADERWRAFHSPARLPVQTEVLEDGRQLSPHDPLLPAVLALPVAVGGWFGAKLAMAGLAGVLAAATAWLAHRRLAVPLGVAVVVTAAFAAAPPLAVYGTQVYPEVPAALVTVIGVACATGALGRRGRIGVALAVGALPWLAVKYAPVAVTIGTAAAARLLRDGRRREAARLAAALAVAAAVALVGHRVLYGGWTPYATGDHFVGGELDVVGTDPDYAGRSRRLAGLLVDRAFGLVPWMPAFLLLPVALGALVRRRPAWAPAVVAPLAAGWLVATFVALTMHGFWWPGRQVVVVVPLAVASIAWWAAAGRRRVGVVVAGGLLGASCFVWLVVRGLRERVTWVADFASPGPPTYRWWRPILPDGTSGDGFEIARHLGWAAVLLALVAIGLSGWRRRGRPAPP